MVRAPKKSGARADELSILSNMTSMNVPTDPFTAKYVSGASQ